MDCCCIRIALISLLLLLFSNCANNDSTGYSTVAATSSSISPKEQELTSELESALNQYRISIGKKAIMRSRALDRLAREHSAKLAYNYKTSAAALPSVSHLGFEERVFLAKKIHGVGSMAENVAVTLKKNGVAQELTRLWVNSKNHVYNLNQRWDETGIGVVVAHDGSVFATQLFANRSDFSWQKRDTHGGFLGL